MKNSIIFSIALVLLLTSCNKKVKSVIVDDTTELMEVATARSEKKEECNCFDPHNYAPDERYPEYQHVKYIRVNFHYPNSTSLAYNYTGEDAVKYSQDLVNNANRKMKKNQKMNLPVGNDTPVYDTGYRYKIVDDATTESGLGIYVDVDDEHWDYIKKGKGRNNYDKTLVKKFVREKESVLNIYAMAYSPDSLAREGFKGGSAGIALGTSLKIAGIKAAGIGSAWKFSTLMNHEIGHVFGLRHSWYKNDGCDDTPPNANCWGSTDSGKCAGPQSNNLMDYNTQQMAITPCQIGVVRKSMHKRNSKTRKLVVQDWCDLDLDQSLVIAQDHEIDRGIDMKGNIEVMPGATLRLSCRVHMPRNGKIIVHPGALLELNAPFIHNDCGDEWGGFEILSKGGKKGEIVYLGNVKIENMAGDDAPVNE